MSHTAITAREGVEVTRTALIAMSWFPREPSDPDYGVDLLAEAAPDGIPNGRLLALQVKSGSTHVTVRGDTHATLPCTDKHVKYWLGHSLEVIVVWYDPEQKTAHWQAVNSQTLVRAGNNWKIEIPLDQMIDASSDAVLRDLASEPAATTSNVNWAQVLASGPLALLDSGQERYEQAIALKSDQPAQASEQLAALAGELETRHGDSGGSLTGAAERLREQAAQISFENGDQETAIRLRIGSIRQSVLLARQPLSVRVDQLRAWLEHEEWWVADAWQACLDWPEDPVWHAQALANGLAKPSGPPVSEEDRTLWRERLIELRFINEEFHPAIHETNSLLELTAQTPDIEVRLHALRAEALESAGAGDAQEAWQQLADWAQEQEPDRPAISAVVLARRAVAHTRNGNLAAAETGFAAAAGAWSQIPGAGDEVAEQYYSSHAAQSLIGGPWSGRQDWRTVAAALRGQRETPDAIAERLELQGLNARVIGQSYDSLNRLALAHAEHRRAGHLRGELYATHLLMELYSHAGEHGAALDAAIRAGRGPDATRISEACDADEVMDAIRRDGPRWTAAPSLQALGGAGALLDQSQVAQVADWVLQNAGLDEQTAEDRDALFGAHAALGALILEWPTASAPEAIARLQAALESGNLLLAEPAAKALQVLTNVQRGDYTGVLTEAFLGSEHARVSAIWVAGRIHRDTEARTRVLKAAAEGRLDALEAACTSQLNHPEIQILDAPARAALDQQLANLLGRTIGHTADGAVIGMLRLEPWGVFARVSENTQLRSEVAERILEFALDDEEPHSNRSSAVNAIFNLAGALQPEQAETFAERLRPIAEGQFGSSRWDQPRKEVEHPFNRHRFGDHASADLLHGAAVLACAALAGRLQEQPEWPGQLLQGALASSEPRVMIGALEAIGRLEETPIPAELPAYLLHADPEVRSAAVRVWGRRKADTPPPAVLGRLAEDENVDVRLALLALLRDGNRDSDIIAKLAESDPDSYVRAAAQTPLPDAGASG